MKCLVCNLEDVGEVDSYSICSICGRENEQWGIGDDEFGGPNYFTVNDHRDLWELDGSRSWSVSGATKIDQLAHYIQEGYGLETFELTAAEYKRVVGECRRLMNQANFNIDADLERRAHQ